MKKAILGAVLVLVATVVALPVAAAPGYWRYQGYRVEPDPATLPKGLPARQISGGLQVKPTTSGSLSMGFTNEDVEKVRYTTSLQLGFQMNRAIESLRPGDKVRVRAQLSFAGNAKAAALPSDASGQLAVDDGSTSSTCRTRGSASPPRPRATWWCPAAVRAARWRSVSRPTSAPTARSRAGC